jgi:peptidoglycan/LPS O-acetylase OafA/YrhL
VTLSAVLSTTIVAAFAFGDGVVARLLSRTWPRRLGGMTYAAYVFHIYAIVVVWAICKHLKITMWFVPLVRAALAIPLTFAIAALSNALLGRPFLKLKSKYAVHS